mgnify:FL=1
MEENKIIDLLGNIFEVIPGFKFSLGLPQLLFKENIKTSFNRDRISDKEITIVNKRDKWYCIEYVSHLDGYIIRNLKYIRYEEIVDIRFEWKHKDKKEIERFMRSFLSNAKT